MPPLKAAEYCIAQHLAAAGRRLMHERKESHAFLLPRMVTKPVGGVAIAVLVGPEKIFCSVGINHAVSGSRLLEAALA